MAEAFVRIDSNEIKGNEQRTLFFIPAATRTGARARVKANIKLRGYRNAEIVNMEKVSGGYEAAVLSDR